MPVRYEPPRDPDPMSAPVRFEDAIAFASELIRLPSLPGQEAEVAARVRAELERLGFERVRTDEVGNVIGVIPGTAGGPSVMLSSHLDIVAAGSEEGWEHPPFSGAIADGF